MIIDYELSIDDSLMYMEYQVLNKFNPSINDSVKRWGQFCFVILVVLFPSIVFLISRSVRGLAICLIVALAIYLAMNHGNNLRKLWWSFYQKKAREDLENGQYTNGQKTIPKKFIVEGGKVILESLNRELSIQRESIIRLDRTAAYYFIFFDTYEGTLIPREGLSKVERQWFDQALKA